MSVELFRDDDRGYTGWLTKNAPATSSISSAP